MTVYATAKHIRNAEIIGLSSNVARAIAKDVQDNAETVADAIERLRQLEDAIAELRSELERK